MHMEEIKKYLEESANVASEQINLLDNFLDFAELITTKVSQGGVFSVVMVVQRLIHNT